MKEFFNVFAPKYIQTGVQPFLDTNENMTSLAANFYHCLLSVDGPTFETSCCREQIWS